MRHDFTSRKRVILGALTLLIIADVALAAYSWQLASAPRTPQQQFAAEIRRHDLLKADIKRAQDIRDNIPAIQRDCDKFDRSLFPASSGYSSVTSELGGMAKRSSVHLDDVTFKETEIAGRRLTGVMIDATVDGDYKSVIQFLNALQRSTNLYEVDSLNLATENANRGPANVIKVALHLKTYFRTAS